MSTAMTTRGPYAPSIRRREIVTRAVLELVDELGHEGVTTALISQRSGVSETTVLYHFPSKDHLLVAALALADEQAAEAAHADDASALLDANAIARLASLDLTNSRNRLYFMLRGLATTPDHPAAAHFAQRATRQVELFAQLITHSQEAGLVLGGLDPETTARQVIAVWDGLSQLWVADPTFDIGPVLEDAIRRLTGQDLLDIQTLVNRQVTEDASSPAD